MTSISKIALACAALVAASGAFAQKAGDNIISIGLASINPDASVGPLTNTTLVPGGGGATYGMLLAGTTANVSSETTVAIGWLRMFTDNVGAELTMGLPPTVTQDLTTPHVPGSTSHPGAARIDVWTPTIVGKYFFGAAQDTWRPYVGLGVSRVSFHNISINRADPAVLGLAGTSANLSSSWTPVYNAGVIYNIDDKWSISASVAYLPIKTDATFVGTDGTTTGSVKLNTTDYVVKMGYRF
ncbi:OmpW family outer membrane protein [Limnohabitans sp. INBF002]|uniref:OmpW/AlkL family protein n=1 Tax=Limnohabitans sp. INBF002 TaxID=2986280 RepID=UPI002377A737|nr:OmpW family outer membrane protein [Limnohabitans sp. INBF002]BDU52104.1 outer membrane protein [Limnohabitans sp. INBF002]